MLWGTVTRSIWLTKGMVPRPITTWEGRAVHTTGRRSWCSSFGICRCIMRTKFTRRCTNNTHPIENVCRWSSAWRSWHSISCRGGIQCGSGRRNIPDTLSTFHKFLDGLLEGRLGVTRNGCHHWQRRRCRYRNYRACKSWGRGRRKRLGSFICPRWATSGGSAAGRVARV